MIEVSKAKQAAQTGNSMTSAVGAETTLNTRADRIAYGRGNQKIFLLFAFIAMQDLNVSPLVHFFDFF